MIPANDTKWLTRFKINITSNSNKIFGNGRHQLEVSVSLTPKAGNEVTEEQLDTIRLVTLDDDGVYQPLSGELQVTNERDTRFEYYADTGSAPSPLLEAPSRRRRFYVSSTRPGGSLDVIYAAISKDEDTHYVSHTSVFNASETVETLTPLRLNRDDFTLLVEDNHEHKIGATRWDYDIYQLFLKSRHLRIVQSIPYGAKSGQPYYQKIEEEEDGWFLDGETVWSWTHVAYEVSNIKTFRVPHVTLSVNRHPGSLLCIRIKTEGTVNLSGGRNTSSVWGLIDQYGNEHKVEMTQTSNGNLIDFVMAT